MAQEFLQDLKAYMSIYQTYNSAMPIISTLNRALGICHAMHDAGYGCNWNNSPACCELRFFQGKLLETGTYMDEERKQMENSGREGGAEQLASCAQKCIGWRRNEFAFACKRDSFIGQQELQGPSYSSGCRVQGEHSRSRETGSLVQA